MTTKKISLIIPVHNEADIIEEVVRSYYDEVISKIPGSEFIIAEDGSTDGTKEILRNISRKLPVTVVSSNQRKGYGAAVLDALKLPKNEVVFLGDSDGQHKVSDFWKLFSFIEDFDIVTGYKCPRSDSLFRLFISRVMNTFIFFMFGCFFRDINSGFKLFRKKALDSLLEECEGWDFISTELLIRAHLMNIRYAEVPINHYVRKFGESRGLPLVVLPLKISKLLFGMVRLRRRYFFRIRYR